MATVARVAVMRIVERTCMRIASKLAPSLPTSSMEPVSTGPVEVAAAKCRHRAVEASQRPAQIELHDDNDEQHRDEDHCQQEEDRLPRERQAREGRHDRKRQPGPDRR